MTPAFSWREGLFKDALHHFIVFQRHPSLNTLHFLPVFTCLLASHLSHCSSGHSLTAAAIKPQKLGITVAGEKNTTVLIKYTAC